ncbi:hypothetical protein [Sutterella sp.]|uniref:hypothetical protein n=1 Tax=Sutterella sp. TaxID=1981025 RepID=UPI0025CD96C6|nr:hypothetical protein [uncultured Sutterella sp.]
MRRTLLSVLLSAPILLGAGAAAAASSSSAAPAALADCLYKNTGTAERTVFLQWAYVTLGKTDAAKAVAAIPSAKTKQVETQAQTALTKVVLKSCPKEAVNVLLADPRNGLQTTLVALAEKLVAAEIEKRTTPILNLTITDLLRR